MIYTKLTKKALRICFDAHKDQVDKNGMPYVFHPFHLAEQMKDEYTTCVALLHDVVEDSAYSLQDLTNAGFPEEVVHAVARMSHDIFVPYMDYVRTLSTDPLARTVKLADLAHKTEANVCLSMWKENEFRFNDHLKEKWNDFRWLEQEHFYHIGAKESNRHPMIEVLDTYLEDYINENFGEYTLILAENNQSFIINEENDGYMVMEYDF